MSIIEQCSLCKSILHIIETFGIRCFVLYTTTPNNFPFLFCPNAVLLRNACSNLFVIYSLCGRSKYSINTCFVSSLLNLFVSRRTHRYIIILGQHHRFPSYFCGLRACLLARSLAHSLRTLLLHLSNIISRS